MDRVFTVLKHVLGATPAYPKTVLFVHVYKWNERSKYIMTNSTFRFVFWMTPPCDRIRYLTLLPGTRPPTRKQYRFVSPSQTFTIATLTCWSSPPLRVALSQRLTTTSGIRLSRMVLSLFHYIRQQSLYFFSHRKKHSSFWP